VATQFIGEIRLSWGEELGISQRLISSRQLSLPRRLYPRADHRHFSGVKNCSSLFGITNYYAGAIATYTAAYIKTSHIACCQFVLIILKLRMYGSVRALSKVVLDPDSSAI